MVEQNTDISLGELYQRLETLVEANLDHKAIG